MGYSPITPFRRTIDAVLLDHEARSRRAVGQDPVDKWEVLRDLAAGRADYGLSDRDLTVLQALLSFHPAQSLDPGAGPLVIHPANRTICERLNGMPCSTMRRHVARLVSAGILVRRDSPNGKRYARQSAGTRIAFGFDLSPLVHRAEEFRQAAASARQAREELRRLRETASLLRRDLAELAAYGKATQPGLSNWDAVLDMTRLTVRTLRRQLGQKEVEAVIARLETALTEVRETLQTNDENDETSEMSTCDARNEQHHTEIKKEDLESEPGEQRTVKSHTRTPEKPREGRGGQPPSIPLSLVLTSCLEMLSYATGRLTDWQGLQETAERVRPMMGIAPGVWSEARRVMGGEEAAIVLAAMLERFEEIRSPDAYLRTLCLKAANGKFSAARMVFALSRRAA